SATRQTDHPTRVVELFGRLPDGRPVLQDGAHQHLHPPAARPVVLQRHRPSGCDRPAKLLRADRRRDLRASDLGGRRLPCPVRVTVALYAIPDGAASAREWIVWASEIVAGVIVVGVAVRKSIKFM